MELSIKLGKEMNMVSNFLDGKILLKEFFCPQSELNPDEIPECVVVIFCDG